jgi:hypothetical protein
LLNSVRLAISLHRMRKVGLHGSDVSILQVDLHRENVPIVPGGLAVVLNASGVAEERQREMRVSRWRQLQ